MTDWNNPYMPLAMRCGSNGDGARSSAELCVFVGEVTHSLVGTRDRFERLDEEARISARRGVRLGEGVLESG